jgi:TPR repeat protein
MSLFLFSSAAQRQKYGLGPQLTVMAAFLLLVAIAPLLAQSNLASLNVNSIRQKAEAGDVAAQAELGERYFAGKGGVARDLTQARVWYQKAADQGNSAAKQRMVTVDKQLANCDLNWSPKFDQITDAGVLEGLREPGLMATVISQAGGLDQLIQESSRTEASDQEEMAEHQDAGDTDGMRKLKALMLVNEGMLEIAECRKARGSQSNVSASVPGGGNMAGQTQNAPATTSGNRPSPAPASTSSSVVDVRYSAGDSRPLSGAEMATLRDSLHWDPEMARLSSGGTAVSYLVDKEGRRLGSIQVQWTRTVVTKGTPSQPAGPPVGSFTVQLENGTSCGFLGEAELDDPKGVAILSSFELDSWVGLGQPRAGQTVRVEGEADLPSANPAILLKPLEVGSTLSACLTPKNR